MIYKSLHRWDVTQQQAFLIQKDLSNKVSNIFDMPFTNIKHVAGCDISFNPGSNVFYAGIVVMAFPSLDLVEKRVIVTKGAFPYVPGLLSFRETPALIEAWRLLSTEPDVVFIDGHGLAHPRKFGIASHFGLLVDKPTIGCAKKLLYGSFNTIEKLRSCKSSLVDKTTKEQLGVVLRTQATELPVYVSIGHNIDLETAQNLVLATTKTSRIPLPTLMAHNLVNDARKGLLSRGDG